MAARLVGRCCWRHLAAISLGPGPASGLRHPPRASSLHAPGAAAAAEGSALKEKTEENPGAQGPKALRELLEAAQGPRELLELSEEPGLSSNQASLLIGRLSRLAAQQQLEPQGLLQDPRFKQLLGVMDSQVGARTRSTALKVPPPSSFHFYGCFFPVLHSFLVVSVSLSCHLLKSLVVEAFRSPTAPGSAQKRGPHITRTCP